MGDTIRTTRACTLASLSPSLVDALTRRMTPDDLTIVMCCETVSTTVTSGMFRRRKVTRTTAMIVTPKRLIWATAGPDGAPVARSVPLRDIEVHDYERSDEFRLNPDSGITVDGLPTDVPGRTGSAFIGIGPEAAGGHFRRALRQSVIDARRAP